MADHCVVQPATLGIKRHELNKPHLDIFFTTKRGEGDDFVVVHPALHNSIYLYRRHTHCNCSIDAFEHRSELVTLGDLLELFAVQRVEAHVDAPQTGTLQVGGHQRERGAIGGDRHVDGLASQRRIGGGRHGEHGECRDQFRKVGPHGGLATGEANAIHPKTLDTDACNAGDFFIGQHFGARQPHHAFFGHAIGAAKVAAVGYRNAQVAHRATVRIDEFGLGRARHGQSLRPLTSCRLRRATAHPRCHQHRCQHRRARMPGRWPSRWLPVDGCLAGPSRAHAIARRRQNGRTRA